LALYIDTYLPGGATSVIICGARFGTESGLICDLITLNFWPL